jgi:heme exporter protein CcmD
MYFDSVADALAMGGHGAFVWGAYGITFVIIFFMLLRPVMFICSLNAGIRQEALGKQSAQVAQENAS